MNCEEQRPNQFAIRPNSTRLVGNEITNNTGAEMVKTLDLEEAAKEAAGNWKKFRCFVWWREKEMSDADQWAIIYTDNRDSGLIDQSNAAVIREALVPFTKGRNPSVVFESHSHWVCVAAASCSVCWCCPCTFPP